MVRLKHTVFVSYSSDAVDFAKALAARLDSAGYAAILDRWDLPPGKAYDARLEDEVKSSSLFLFVISERSVLANAFAITELAWAAASRRRIIGVHAPGHSGVPPPPEVAARTLSRSDGDQIANTVSEVRDILGRPVARVAKIAMIAIGIAALAAICWVLLVYLQDPPELIVKSTLFDEHLRRAEAALAAGNHQSAITFFQNAQRERPDHWAPYQGLGRVEFERGNYAAAVGNFERSLEKMTAKDGAVLYGQALALQGLEQYRQALDKLQLAAKVLSPVESPLSLDVLFDQGLMNLILWLKQDAPRDSQHYVDAENSFRQFAEGNGSPKSSARDCRTQSIKIQLYESSRSARDARGLVKRQSYS